MIVEENDKTSSSVPKGEYNKPCDIELDEITRNRDTSREVESRNRVFRITITKGTRDTHRLRLNIEKEEKKRFFSRLNESLKKIK